jgi:putative SOS response-associated peptidase YedK
MCGRFPASKSSVELKEEFHLASIRAVLPPSWNVAPTEPAPVILRAPEGLVLDAFRWGLIPWFAKDARDAARAINARAETLAEKPSFRDAFAQRRCVVVADGFYEWKLLHGRKVPHFIRLRDGHSMTFAGLWDKWRAPNDQEIYTCTIVTTTPNELMASLHDRMPVILDADAREAWLGPAANNREAAEALLRACPSDWLEVFPVSSAVNTLSNKGPECVKPEEPTPPRQGELF